MTDKEIIEGLKKENEQLKKENEALLLRLEREQFKSLFRKLLNN